MDKKKQQYYVNPKELRSELQYFKETDIISEKLGKMILNIAQRYSSRPNFSGYSYKEEFVGTAVLRMIEQLAKIDLNHPKCNPFAYLTQICHFKFIEKINKEKKYQTLKTKLVDHYYDEFENSESLKNTGNTETDD